MCTGETSDVPVIVNIDEKSLMRYGQWPWPRYRIAILLEKLKQAGALSIALDMLFAEPDRTSIDIIKKDMQRDRPLRSKSIPRLQYCSFAKTSQIHKRFSDHQKCATQHP